MADSLSRTVFFVAATGLAGTVGIERLAEYFADDRPGADHTLAGLAKRILSAGNGIGKRRQRTGGDAAAALSQKPQEFRRLIPESRKHFVQILIPHVPRNRFAKDLPKIGGQSEIAAFV